MERTRLDPLLEPKVDHDPIVREMQRAPGQTWGWVMAYGVVLLLAALIVLVNPLVAGVATGLILGVMLVVYGVAAIAAGWTSLSTRARWTEILLGALALIAGIFTIVDPVAGALSLVWAIGVWLVIAGGFQIAAALKARHDKGWRLFMGVLDVVLGLVLLFAGPVAGLAFLALIVAISLTVRAVFLIQLALVLKKSDHI